MLKRSAKSKQYSLTNREPWLLITSLQEKTEKIVQIYKSRMQIEENFRDTKSIRYGFALNESGSKTTQRMSILLLISALASFVCWITGFFVQKTGKAPSFQAHSSKNNALSIVYLGKQVLKSKFNITKKQFNRILSFISNIVSFPLEITC